MTKRTFRAILLLLGVAAIICGTCLTGFVLGHGLCMAAEHSGIYLMQKINEYENRFVNLVDGYGIAIPKQMEVVVCYPGISTILEDQHRRVEIYKESTANGVSKETYINYSNRFLNNRTDHLQVRSEKLVLNGTVINVVQWSREKLARIENDRNYYTCVDILTSDAVYTFFFKSDRPLEECGGYQDIIKGFYTFAPTQHAGAIQFKQVTPRKWNQETSAFFHKYFSADSPLHWGIFEPAAPFDMHPLQNLEKRLDYEFPFIVMYCHVSDQFDPKGLEQALRNAYLNGKTVELTLQTHATDSSNMVYRILKGEYDDYLQAYARVVADFGHPVLFRPFNEMNGDWCSYSAYHTSRDTDIFKALYRYIHGIFAEAGAENVIWVWNPNERSFPDFKWNHEIMYYPGDKYVDVVGLTGYNTGTYYQGETWRSFQEIYAPLYQKATGLYEKPLMITEFACSRIGGDKEQWVQDMFDAIADFPAIKVAIWWDGCDWDTQGNIARPYFIDDSNALVSIFRQNLQQYKH